ncbi:hypothetical protein [Arthrobacter sp. MAHUQ-56]
MNLSAMQARMAACSLEIDGRADIAAQAAISGHATEFTYRQGQPESPKARRRQETQGAIQAAVEARGLPAVIAELRSTN